MAIVRTACTMTLDRKDLDEVVGIFEKFIKDVEEKDHGMLAYHYFIDEDPLTIHVIEWYESPQAMLDHYANLDLETAGRLRRSSSSSRLSTTTAIRRPRRRRRWRASARCTSTARSRASRRPRRRPSDAPAASRHREARRRRRGRRRGHVAPRSRVRRRGVLRLRRSPWGDRARPRRWSPTRSPGAGSGARGRVPAGADGEPAVAGRLVRRRHVVQRRAVRPRPRARADRSYARGADWMAGSPSASGGLPPAMSSSPFSPRSAPAASAAISSRRPIRSRMRFRAARLEVLATGDVAAPIEMADDAALEASLVEAGIVPDFSLTASTASVTASATAAAAPYRAGRRLATDSTTGCGTGSCGGDGERRDRPRRRARAASTSRTSGSGIPAVAPGAAWSWAWARRCSAGPTDSARRSPARGVHVIRFDNRDIGLSTSHDGCAPARRAARRCTGDTSSASYTLSDMAGDTVGLLDALGLESAHLVGASMGGMIAQTLAIEHPERVRSLTSIMSSTGDQSVGQATRRAIGGAAVAAGHDARGGDRADAWRSCASSAHRDSSSTRPSCAGGRASPTTARTIPSASPGSSSRSQRPATGPRRCDRVSVPTLVRARSGRSARRRQRRPCHRRARSPEPS